MKATQKLHDLGQSLWLDNITRNLLTNGTLRRYIDELSVSGLTSNPTIFNHAVKNSTAYDTAISAKIKEGKSEKICSSNWHRRYHPSRRPVPADLRRTCGVDGWVSLEVSPLLAHNTKTTLAVAKELHARAGRPNLFIKIPGTPEGLPAIEESIYAGVPIIVTLLLPAATTGGGRGLFPRHRAADRRRTQAGCRLGSLAFHQPLGHRDQGQVPGAAESARHRCRQTPVQGLLRPDGRAPLAAGLQCRGSPTAAFDGQHGHQDPKASDILYVKALAAPLTVATMPEATLKRLPIMARSAGDLGRRWRL